MIKLVLFFNNQTNGSTNAPYFQGKLTMADGTELKTALWTNVSAAGVTYYSGHAKPFEPNPAQVQAEGYRNYNPPTAPAQPEPAPAAPEPVQDPPADPEFIQETIKEWEDRTKADIPDLGRRRLDPPRTMDNNAFLNRLKYNESKALINVFVNTPIDDITAELSGQYYEARAFVDQYEAETNKFWLKSQYMLAKELVHKIQESNLDVVNPDEVNEEMYEQYKLAIATVKDWERKHPNDLFQPNR